MCKQCQTKSKSESESSNKQKHSKSCGCKVVPLSSVPTALAVGEEALEEYASNLATSASVPQKLVNQGVYTVRGRIAKTLEPVRKHKVDKVTGELFDVPKYRTCTCSNVIGQQASLVHTTNGKLDAHKYTGLETCSSVWLCPVCSKKISSYRANEITSAMEQLVSMGYKPLMVTATIRHDKDTKLIDSLDTVIKSLAYVTRHRRYKQALANSVYISATEITYSETNGWHPHQHRLLFLPPGSAATEASIKALIYDLTQDFYTKNNFDISWERGINVRESFTSAEYLAKFGYTSDWRAGQELTLNLYKPNHPFSVAETNPTAFREYAFATLGRRQLTVSESLRKLLPEFMRKNDEEIAVAEDVEFVQTPVIHFDRKQWRKLQKAEALDKLLTVAKESRKNAYSELYAFIEIVLRE